MSGPGTLSHSSERPFRSLQRLPTPVRGRCRGLERLPTRVRGHCGACNAFPLQWEAISEPATPSHSSERPFRGLQRLPTPVRGHFGACNAFPLQWEANLGACNAFPLQWEAISGPGMPSHSSGRLILEPATPSHSSGRLFWGLQRLLTPVGGRFRGPQGFNGSRSISLEPTVSVRSFTPLTITLLKERLMPTYRPPLLEQFWWAVGFFLSRGLYTRVLCKIYASFTPFMPRLW